MLVLLGTATGVPAQPEAPSTLPAVRFDIAGYRIAGNRVQDDAALARAVAPHAGAGRDFGDIRAAVAAIRAAYENAGYRGVAVTVPEQDLDGGLVKIEVVEPVIEEVRVAGNRHFDGDFLHACFPMLAPGRPVNFDELGSALDAVNDNPALKVAVAVEAGANPGSRRALIEAADEPPVAWFAALDDSGTDATGKARLTVGGRDADFSGRGDALTAQYTVSAEKSAEVSAWGLGYRLPLPADGARFEAYAGHSSADSGNVAGLFGVAGKGTVAGAKLAWHLPRGGDGSRRQLAFGLDFRDYENRVVPIGGTRSLVPDYTVHPASLSWSWRLGESAAEIAYVGGFEGVSRSAGEVLSQVRAGARSGYALVRYAASHTRPLPGDWTARAELSGQLTGDALVPGEQFGLGGAQSVRGFDERHATGDDGFRVSFELGTPQALWGEVAGRGVVFVDWGELHRNAVQPGEHAKETLAGWGIGWRARLGSRAAVSLDLAQVARGTARQPAGRGRTHFSLQMTF